MKGVFIKEYTLLSSGDTGAKVTVNDAFLVRHKLRIGDKVSEFINEEGDLVVSPAAPDGAPRPRKGRRSA